MFSVAVFLDLDREEPSASRWVVALAHERISQSSWHYIETFPPFPWGKDAAITRARIAMIASNVCGEVEEEGEWLAILSK
jgi:hypothetical protein